MATIGSLALAIRARTEQLKGDLKPALDAIKGWGTAARAAGADSKEVDRAMARMRAEAMQGAKETGGLSDSLKKGRVAASSFAGAVSAVSSELGGAVGSVTRLGSSLAQAFLAGGPIALGVTALTAGIGGLVGVLNESTDAVKKTREESKAWVEENKRGIEEVIERTQRLKDKLAESRGQAPAGSADEGEVARRFKKEQDLLEKNIAEERRKLEAWRKERAALQQQIDSPSGGGPFVRGEAAKRDADIAAAEARIRGYQESLAAAKKLAAAELESINHARTLEEVQKKQNAYAERLRGLVKGVAADFDAAAKAAAGLSDRERMSIEGMAAARERVAQLMGEREKAIDKQAKDSVGKAKQIAKGLNDGAEAGKKWAQEQKDFKQSLADELEILKAANDYERERIEIRRRLAEDIKKAAGDEKAIADAQAIAAEKLAQVGAAEAKAAKDKADEEARATAEKQKQLQIDKDRLDVNKGFAALPGTGGVFGFGRRPEGPSATVFGGGSGDMGTKSNPNGGAGAPTQAAQKPPTDVSPKVQELIKTIGMWAESHEKLAGGIDKIGAAAEGALDRVTKATTKAVAGVATRVKSLETRVRAAEQALQRAAAGAGVGGD